MEAMVFLVIIIWISLCFVAGAITENKGNSFIHSGVLNFTATKSHHRNCFRVGPKAERWTPVNRESAHSVPK